MLLYFSFVHFIEPSQHFLFALLIPYINKRRELAFLGVSYDMIAVIFLLDKLN